MTIYARAPAGFPGSYSEKTFALPADLPGDVAYLTRAPLACDTRQPVEIATVTPDHGHFDGTTVHLYRTVPACLPPQ